MDNLFDDLRAAIVIPHDGSKEKPPTKDKPELDIIIPDEYPMDTWAGQVWTEQFSTSHHADPDEEMCEACALYAECVGRNITHDFVGCEVALRLELDATTAERIARPKKKKRRKKRSYANQEEEAIHEDGDNADGHSASGNNGHLARVVELEATISENTNCPIECRRRGSGCADCTVSSFAESVDAWSHEEAVHV